MKSAFVAASAATTPAATTAKDTNSDAVGLPLAMIDLVAPDTLGQELIVSASNRVFIERSLNRGDDLSGRSGSWALPAYDS